jgi:hypothetical protein
MLNNIDAGTWGVSTSFTAVRCPSSGSTLDLDVGRDSDTGELAVGATAVVKPSHWSDISVSASGWRPAADRLWRAAAPRVSVANKVEDYGASLEASASGDAASVGATVTPFGGGSEGSELQLAAGYSFADGHPTGSVGLHRAIDGGHDVRCAAAFGAPSEATKRRVALSYSATLTLPATAVSNTTLTVSTDDALAQPLGAVAVERDCGEWAGTLGAGAALSGDAYVSWGRTWAGARSGAAEKDDALSWRSSARLQWSAETARFKAGISWETTK